MSTGMVTIEVNRCPHCGTPTAIKLPVPHAEQVRAWQWQDRYTRPFVQTALPFLTPDQREALVSGLHPDCWDEMFGPDDEAVPA